MTQWAVLRRFYSLELVFLSPIVFFVAMNCEGGTTTNATKTMVDAHSMKEKEGQRKGQVISRIWGGKEGENILKGPVKAQK